MFSNHSLSHIPLDPRVMQYETLRIKIKICKSLFVNVFPSGLWAIFLFVLTWKWNTHPGYHIILAIKQFQACESNDLKTDNIREGGREKPKTRRAIVEHGFRAYELFMWVGYFKAVTLCLGAMS